MPPNSEDAAYWRERAHEARAAADRLRDGDAKRAMLQIAKGYDAMAETTEQRAERQRRAPATIPSSPPKYVT
jgi:hypothetical protein